jgi:hypothetical protein
MQGLPHMPQFSRSILTSTQEPSQFLSGIGSSWQVTSHEPMLQISPLPHAVPQAPQFDLSA